MYNLFHVSSIAMSIFKDRHNLNINNMESDKEVISRLKFIGKIQKGEKINVKYMFVQPEGIATRISRTLIYQDNRQNTLNFLRNTITRSYDIISSCLTSNESQKYIRLNLIEDLKAARDGLINLKDTYLADIKFCCDIDTMLQEINAKLTELEPHLYTTETKTNNSSNYSSSSNNSGNNNSNSNSNNSSSNSSSSNYSSNNNNGSNNTNNNGNSGKNSSNFNKNYRT